MTVIITNESAVRDIVREALNGTGWSNETAGDAKINPVVDPSCAATDPINPNFTPQSKTEFGVAMGQMVKNLPDSDMPAIYSLVKKALDRRTEKEEIDDAQKQAMLAGNQEAIDDAEKNGKKNNEGKMSTRRNIEEAIRVQIRSELAKMGLIVEALVDPADAIADEDPEEQPRSVGAHKSTAIGNMSDVGGASFEQIAHELGFSVAGAKQAVDKALLKAQYLNSMDEDDAENMVLGAMNDYIKMLSQGIGVEDDEEPLTAADVQLMKDHPDIVIELDGFREFLHNYVKREMKIDNAELGDEAPPQVKVPVASVPKPAAPAGAVPSTLPQQRGQKGSYKIYGRKSGRPAHTRLKGQTYGAPDNTRFKPGETAAISPDNGKLRVTADDRDQLWEPVDG
jgi:hypothetical protein